MKKSQQLDILFDMSTQDVKDLQEWFVNEQRDFPWREQRSPYIVLVSEIMLQQTKAVTVLPFFIKWMELFPDFRALSQALEDDVIKAWEGLGYYSRARNLHGIAKRVEEEFKGVFPSDLENILSFKGIGPYTAAAISHFAFDTRAIGADGNIKKVIARYYGYTGRIDKDKELLELLDDFLPKKSANVFEGLIELGATLCAKKNPRCMACPLSGGCRSHIEGLTGIIPVVKKREKIIPIDRSVYLVEHNGSYLIKRQKEGIMQGLYEFPFVQIGEGVSKGHCLSEIEKILGLQLELKGQMKEETHSFTKYKATLTPYLCIIKNMETIPTNYQLVSKAELKKYPFSSGHRKIMHSLL